MSCMSCAAKLKVCSWPKHTYDTLDFSFGVEEQPPINRTVSGSIPAVWWHFHWCTTEYEWLLLLISRCMMCVCERVNVVVKCFEWIVRLGKHFINSVLLLQEHSYSFLRFTFSSLSHLAYSGRGPPLPLFPLCVHLAVGSLWSDSGQGRSAWGSYCSPATVLQDSSR